MAFYDWNHNGKKDFGDDFIEYNIYKDCTDDKPSNNNSGGNNDGCSWFFWFIVIIVILAILGVR